MLSTESSNPPTLKGLSSTEALARRQTFGPNELPNEARNHFLQSLLHVVREPMFLLLLVACVLYFFLGDLTEAMMMLLSVLFVASIEIYQETRSEKALEALRAYTRAQVRVLRDGVWVELPSEALVPDDIIGIGEGERIPADGVLLQQNDLFVDESVLTGESLSVEKTGAALLFQGTTVAGGQGQIRVTATGARTEFGKLGRSIENIESEKTPLQAQITRFVRQMGILGVVSFAVVFGLNLWQEHDIWKALLFSLTVAMALIPEEIPVAFSTFMGLGALRMMKIGILAKQPKTVESLGSATVVCLDKTGTITENKMSVAEISNAETLQIALFASEPEPLDAMERAILQAMLEKEASDPRQPFRLVREYALGGKPPMMTHIWQSKNKPSETLIAAKGAIERILQVCKMGEKDKEMIFAQTESYAQKGFRVLGVAQAEMPKSGLFPAEQDNFDWNFVGLIAFFDPPKANAKAVFQQLHAAGIRVVMITGDQVATAQNIARSVGIQGWERAISGATLMELDETQFALAVKETQVFARMFPDAKLRVVQALKKQGETVAMSGDGVNDGPALKAAQIGVAMGKRGSDIAKNAASLVLLEDNLAGLVSAVALGRRIYDNLRKSIRYIISIHLPIVLVVLVPLVLGWEYPHILLPLHVIFLELVMDPISAIAFENEPAEPDLLQKPPRRADVSLFAWHEMGLSLLQGALIGLGVLFAYRHAIGLGWQESGVRAAVFSTMVFANIFLTLTNRSFQVPMYRTLFYPNKSLPLILALSSMLLLAILYTPFLSGLFGVSQLSLGQLGLCAAIAFVSVAWFEVWKILRLHQQNHRAA